MGQTREEQELTLRQTSHRLDHDRLNGHFRERVRILDGDFRDTIKTRGATLFLNKKVIAVAGERLPDPKTVREAVPLKPSERSW